MHQSPSKSSKVPSNSHSIETQSASTPSALRTANTDSTLTIPPNDPTASESKPLLWRRLITGGCFILLGGAGMAIGITTLQFRFAHLVVDNALVNGRVVQLQSPTDGRIKEWYARPGVVIPAGQMLAQIEQSSQNEQTLLQLTGDLQLNQAQLATANQALTQLKTQMQNLESQRQAFQKSDVVQTDSVVAEREAAVEVALAQANAARDEHERYARLLLEGADSPLRVEQLRSTWLAASATLKQAQSALQSAQASSNAAKQGVPNQSVATNLLQQRNQLTQAAQTQSTLIRTLETQLKTNQQRLQQARSLQSDRQNLSIMAPFKGVIYNADHEQGEAVIRTQPLLTLLDCNEIWVEVIVSVNEASTIDPQAPVMVQFVGSASPIVGKINLIQPISSVQQIEEHPRLTQSVAIPPVIPINLIGQPVARIKVRIPPPPQYNQAQQFCGVGQAVQITFQRKSS